MSVVHTWLHSTSSFSWTANFPHIHSHCNTEKLCEVIVNSQCMTSIPPFLKKSPIFSGKSECSCCPSLGVMCISEETVLSSDIKPAPEQAVLIQLEKRLQSLKCLQKIPNNAKAIFESVLNSYVLLLFPL